MAVSQIINVIVNSRGAVTVQKQLNAIGDSARQTTTYLNSLRAVLSAALTFSGMSSIIETADMVTVLGNRLKQVSDSADMAAMSWTRLMDIANGSYSTMDSTVNLYFRAAQAYRAWGKSAEEAFEFTDLFQKAAILSGSSMQTTAQAVYQFGQALNKGKLDGDEFRSVLEGLPYVATLIQNELGVTRAELYELSKDGKITLDALTGAFVRASKKITADWSNVTPTIGMALNVLRNNWTDFIKDIQESTGVFSYIASAIIIVANNFSTLAIAMTPVAATLAYMAGRLVLGLLVTGFRDMAAAIMRIIPAIYALNAALWANPYIIVAAGVTALVGAIIYFRNELGLTDQVLGAFWESAKNVFTTLLSYFSPISLALTTIIKQFGGWEAVFAKLKGVAESLWKTLVEMFKSITKAVSDFGSYLVRVFTPVWDEMQKLGQAYKELIMEIVGIFTDAFTPAIQALQPTFQTVWNYIRPALQMFIGFLADILQGWQIIGAWLRDNFLPIVKHVFEGWIEIIKTVISFITTLINALKTAVSLMGKVGGGSSGAGGGAAAYYGAQFYAGEFANGGAFKVGGSGAGRDNTPVSFRAQRGERVTVETKKQQRQNDNGNQQPMNVNVPLQVVNVFDPSMIPVAIESSKGQRSVVNAIVANRDEIIYALGIS